MEESTDVHYRFPPSSSALAALSTLTPPSPILSPSQVSATWTSGSIPILLFDSVRSSFRAIDAASGRSLLGGGRGLSAEIEALESIGNVRYGSEQQPVPMDIGISQAEFRSSESFPSLDSSGHPHSGSFEVTQLFDNGRQQCVSDTFLCSGQSGETGSRGPSTTELGCFEHNGHQPEYRNAEIDIENNLPPHHVQDRNSKLWSSAPGAKCERFSHSVFGREARSVVSGRDRINNGLTSPDQSHKLETTSPSLAPQARVRKLSPAVNIHPNSNAWHGLILDGKHCAIT